jgi:hypothetical protein
MKPSLKKIVFKLMESNPSFTDQDLFNACNEGNYKWDITNFNLFITVDNYKTQFRKQQFLKSQNNN